LLIQEADAVALHAEHTVFTVEQVRVVFVPQTAAMSAELYNAIHLPHLQVPHYGSQPALVHALQQAALAAARMEAVIEKADREKSKNKLSLGRFFNKSNPDAKKTAYQVGTAMVSSPSLH
jgi:hypothetical protein